MSLRTTMDLLLWRHAEADDLSPSDWNETADLSRRLTLKGEKQARRMGKWLDMHMPENIQIWVSPAVRAEQTALALGRRYKLSDQLLPQADEEALFELIKWPQMRGPTLVVGHQPTLGRVAARLLGGMLGPEQPAFSVRKGAVWWLRQRERETGLQTVLLSIQTPELL